MINVCKLEDTLLNITALWTVRAKIGIQRVYTTGLWRGSLSLEYPAKANTIQSCPSPTKRILQQSVRFDVCEVLVLTQSFTRHMSHIVSLAHGYHLLKDLCHWGNLMNRQDWPWHRLHLRTHPQPLSSKRRPKSSQDHWKWAQHQATPLVSALARQKNGGLATTSYCIHMKF